MLLTSFSQPFKLLLLSFSVYLLHHTTKNIPTVSPGPSFLPHPLIHCQSYIFSFDSTALYARGTHSLPPSYNISYYMPSHQISFLRKSSYDNKTELYPQNFTIHLHKAFKHFFNSDCRKSQYFFFTSYFGIGLILKVYLYCIA